MLRWLKKLIYLFYRAMINVTQFKLEVDWSSIKADAVTACVSRFCSRFGEDSLYRLLQAYDEIVTNEPEHVLDQVATKYVVILHINFLLVLNDWSFPMEPKRWKHLTFKRIPCILRSFLTRNLATLMFQTMLPVSNMLACTRPRNFQSSSFLLRPPCTLRKMETPNI